MGAILMRMLLGSTVAIMLAATTARAQGPADVFTQPQVPSREALDRLNLKVGYRIALPTNGKRDGIFSFQMAGKQLLVQTRSGNVAAYDRDSGQLLWRTHIGLPYQASQPLGYNSWTVLVVQGTWLYALDRKTGHLQWDFNLPDAASSGPVADEEHFFISLGSRKLSVYQLPEGSRKETIFAGNKLYLPQETAKVEVPGNFYGGSSGTARGVGPLASVRSASKGEATAHQPTYRWGFSAPTELEQQPILGSIDMLWPGANGSIVAMHKEGDASGHPYRFPTEGPISAPAGQYGEVAFVGSHDGNLYAIHLPSGKLLWRFTGRNPIIQKPAVTNEDVYVAPKDSGLYRIDRSTGQTVWRNLDARRFLANNPKFVYAADRNGRLLVLDRARGTTLSSFAGTIDYVVPIANEMTDRIYLAAHDGSLVCLHDRDYATPLTIKEAEEKLLTPPPKPGVRTPNGKPDQMPGKPDGGMPGKPDGKMPGKPDGGMMGKPDGGMEKKP